MRVLPLPVRETVPEGVGPPDDPATLKATVSGSLRAMLDEESVVVRVGVVLGMLAMVMLVEAPLPA